MSLASRTRLQVLGAAFLFSTGGAAIKSAAFTSWQVAGFRSGVAALAVWAFLPAARELRRGRLGITLLVALAYAATLILFVLANKLTTAANTIFLQSTAPLYILLLGPVLLKERITARDLGFMLVVGVGMACFFLERQQSFATAPDPARGNLFAIGSGVAYALMLVGLRWMGTQGGSPAAAVGLGNLLAFLMALPLALPVAGHPAVDWAVIVYLGVFQIGVAYALLTRAIPHIPAFETSLLLFVEPALNPLLAWAVHGEYPGTGALMGGAIILSATGAKTWSDSRRSNRPQAPYRPIV